MAKVKIDSMLKKASDALERRNYDLAVFNYMQALTLQPGHIDARKALRITQNRLVKEKGKNTVKSLIAMLKAQALKAFKKTEQALIAAENSLTANPDNVGMLTMVADCLEAMEYTEAAAWQRQFIADSADPENTDNLDKLADLYADMGDVNAAIASLEKIKAVDPKSDVDHKIRNMSALLSSGIYAQAAKEGSRAIVKDDEETERLELDSAKLRTDEQRLRAIQYRLDHDVQERPDDYRIWLTMASIAYDMENFEEGYRRAKEYLDKARELNPTDSNVMDKQGDLEVKKKRLQIQQMQQAQKENPNDPDMKEAVRKLRTELLHFERQEYERRVKAQPRKAAFHNKLGHVYMQFKKYDDAIAELQDAAKDPKYKIDAHTTMGRCFLATDQPQMAISQFEKARQGEDLFVKIRDTLYWESQAYAAKGDKESLQKAYEIASQIYENDINYKDIKTRVQALQQKIEEAG